MLKSILTCLYFWRPFETFLRLLKVASNDPDTVDAFFLSRNADPNVGLCFGLSYFLARKLTVQLDPYVPDCRQDLQKTYVSRGAEYWQILGSAVSCLACCWTSACFPAHYRLDIATIESNKLRWLGMQASALLPLVMLIRYFSLPITCISIGVHDYHSGWTCFHKHTVLLKVKQHTRLSKSFVTWCKNQIL